MSYTEPSITDNKIYADLQYVFNRDKELSADLAEYIDNKDKYLSTNIINESIKQDLLNDSKLSTDILEKAETKSAERDSTLSSNIISQFDSIINGQFNKYNGSLSTDILEKAETKSAERDNVLSNNIINHVNDNFVEISAVKYDKTKHELYIEDLSIPLVNIEINDENYEELIDLKVDEKTEDINNDIDELRNKYNEAVDEINKRRTYEPDTSEDSWFEVEDNGNVMAANNMFGSWWNPFETTYGKKFKIKQSVIDDTNEMRIQNNLTSEYNNQINDAFDDFDYDNFVKTQVFSELSLSVHVKNNTTTCEIMYLRTNSINTFDKYVAKKFKNNTEFFREHNFQNLWSDISTAVNASKIANNRKQAVINNVKNSVIANINNKLLECKQLAQNENKSVIQKCNDAITQFNNTITKYINDERDEIERVFHQKYMIYDIQRINNKFLTDAICSAGFEILSDDLYDVIVDKLEDIDDLNITKERICIDKNVLNSSLSTHLNLKYDPKYEYKTAMEKALDACSNTFNTIFCKAPADCYSWIKEKCKDGYTKTAAAEAYVEELFKEKVWPVLKDGTDVKIFGTSIPIFGFADIFNCIGTISDKTLNNVLTNYAKNKLDLMTTYVLAALDSDITSDTDYSEGRDFTLKSIDTVSVNNTNYIQLHNFDSLSESSLVVFDKNADLSNYYLLVRENYESDGLKHSELKYAKLSSLNNIVVSNNSNKEDTYIDIKINNDEYKLNLSQLQIVFKDSDTISITTDYEEDGNLVLQFHAHYSYNDI